MPLRIALAVAVVVALAAPAAAAAALYGRVGPGPSISLKRANGTLVTSLQAGTKTFVIRDRATSHNFHLTGPGVDRKTRIAFVGRRTWSGVQLQPGRYTYLCDRHPGTMTRTFTVD